MNIHRTVLAVGQNHFTHNPVGLLHRAISAPSLAHWRLHHARDAAEQRVPTRAWRIAHGATTAASALRKVDNVIDGTFGTCFAQRSAGRPAWESEGCLAQLGKLPLLGFTRVGAMLGSLYGAVSADDRCDTAASGARLGALLGGAIALLWSQSMAAVGFVAKLLLLVFGSAYLTTINAFDPLNEALARDASMWERFQKTA